MTQLNDILAFATAWSENQLALVLELLRGIHAWSFATASDLTALVGLELPDAAMPFLAYGSLAASLLAVLVIARHRWRRSRNPSLDRLASLTRSPKILGIAAAGAFAVVFAGWAVIAPLASAAIAPGVISPDGHRKTVQHLEGGLIRRIHVREGQSVAEGDPLITLDDTAARSLDA